MTLTTGNSPSWKATLASACAVSALVVVGMTASASAADFDLAALIKAAKAEKPITVYSSTGKIRTSAKAFTKKYGIKAIGKKVKSAVQIEMVTREGRANNIVGDVLISSDASATLAELLPSGLVYSWLPPDLAKTISADARNPLVIYRDPAVWTYNNENTKACPVNNIWELTSKKWSRKVAMPDPLNKPAVVDWFNQMKTHWDGSIAKAYQTQFGTKLKTGKKSATEAWVKALAANGPLVTDSDSAVSEAVGAKGQANPFFGILSSSKYRDVKKAGLKMAICKDIKPYVGFANPSYGLIAKGTDSPNAAKLFLRFMMTNEGVSPMTKDGKVSGNTAVPANPKEPSGVGALSNRLTPHNAATGAKDLDARQDWQDLWRVNYKR